MSQIKPSILIAGTLIGAFVTLNLSSAARDLNQPLKSQESLQNEQTQGLPRESSVSDLVAWKKSVESSIEFQLSQYLRQTKPPFRPDKQSNLVPCVVKYTITRDGEIKNVSVVQSSGDVGFDIRVEHLLPIVRKQPYLKLPAALGDDHIQLTSTFSFSQTCEIGDFGPDQHKP